MKKVLSLVLSLVMLLSLVVPVSAEDTYPGSGNLAGKTAAFTIEADDTTLYDNGGEQIVKFHIYAESKANVPIRAFQFTLEPSANLTLATELAADNAGFNYAYQNAGKLIKIPASNPNGMYELFEYKPYPGSRYFGAAGTDEGKGITTKTEIMTIMGKVNGLGEYTLSMTGVVAGNGDAPNNIAEKFTCTVAGATVTVKPEGERPQPNLSLALSTDKVKVGDTFTATLTNKKMSIISFISQTRFNKDVLEVVSITENEGYTNLASGAKTAVITTVADANDRGVVGISVAKTEETTYPVKDIVTVTFKAKAAGEGWFELYESTDGTDGCESDISGGAVTVEAATVTGVTVSGTVKSYGGETENVTVTLTPENGTPMTTVVTGNSAAYKFENVPAGTYTLKVEKKGHAPWTESITVGSAAVTKDVTVYQWGDVNRDGKVTAADAQEIQRNAAKLSSAYDTEPNKSYWILRADVNRDGKVTAADAQEIQRNAAKLSSAIDSLL